MDPEDSDGVVEKIPWYVRDKIAEKYHVVIRLCWVGVVCPHPETPDLLMWSVDKRARCNTRLHVNLTYFS
jgi:hypothetical protein